MKRATIHCPYCRAKATLHPASYVYGESAIPGNYLYVCDRYPACDAYVGAHKKSKLPMGSLANGDLRHKRIEAHKAFNWLWKSGLMTRNQAYIWMQAKLGLNKQQAHIAKFSDYMCEQLISICSEAKENNLAVQRKEANQSGSFLPTKHRPAKTGRSQSTYCATSHSL